MMSTQLDIDDVTADHPMAARQLRDMRTALDAALDVVIDLGGEVREPEMDDARRLRRDAERYRWLRNRLPGSAYRIAGVIYSEGGAGVDAAVDAAMAPKATTPQAGEGHEVLTVSAGSPKPPAWVA